MINIVIADAQYLVRIGLKSLLSTVQDFKVIGEAANTKELLDLISSHHTDVVIFDYFSEHNFLPEDLTKECDKEEIVGAIYATAKSEKFLCHKVIDIIIEKHMHTDEDNCKAFNLSLRETEIIKLTAKGWTAKTIAGHLFLSTHTVYTHKKNIMKKLKINSSSEMIVYAIQNGLVTKEEMAASA